jgi:tetratricopeptide (TPR) repeat protein
LPCGPDRITSGHWLCWGREVAEGSLGGLLGGEEDGPEAEALGEARLGAEAFAAALAADHAKYDPRVARAAETFLEKQARLLDVQTEEIIEQRALRPSHLRNQSRESKIRRVGQRIRVGMQAFVAITASLIAFGLLVMLCDAFNSRSVVVDSFKAPSTLASRGLTGDVVASGVLDGLRKLRTATRSVTKTLDARSAWSSDIKVEVPETGVSIGEIDRLLHERFGHDLHIDGDLIQTETGGLALTVRGDDVPARSFAGGMGDLDKLTTEAAEYVYGRSQPSKYAEYLAKAGRAREALDFIPGALAAGTNAAQQSDLLFVKAVVHDQLNEEVQASQEFEQFMSLVPRTNDRWWAAWVNRINDTLLINGEEAAWRQSEAFLKAFDQTPKRDRPMLRHVATAAEMTWDLPLALAAHFSNASLNGGAGVNQSAAGPFLAGNYALMHDSIQAERYLSGSDPASPVTIAYAQLIQAYNAFDHGAPASAIPPMEAFWKALQAHPSRESAPDTPCLLGLAYGLVGRVADAEAVFAKAGPWSRCYAFHGDVLARSGDVAGARRVWAEGLGIAPDLPMVYLYRGRFELDHGDFKAAQADLSTASAKAPHFADPLKAWGDLLARQGRWRDALAKYDEALKFAPAWVELRQARRAAAMHGS